jgi:hypothetical protein
MSEKMENLIYIKTDKGLIPVVAQKVGEFLCIHPCANISLKDNNYWVVSHLPSGCVVAKVRLEAQAEKLASLLSVACSWDWADPALMPESTKKSCRKVFSSICNSIEFVA